MAGRSLLAVSGVRPAHGFWRSARNSVRAQRASAVSCSADPENLTFSNCFTAWGSKKEVIVTRFVQPNRLPDSVVQKPLFLFAELIQSLLHFVELALELVHFAIPAL